MTHMECDLSLVLRLFGDMTNFIESRLSTEELQQMVHEAPPCEPER